MISDTKINQNFTTIQFSQTPPKETTRNSLPATENHQPEKSRTSTCCKIVNIATETLLTQILALTQYSSQRTQHAKCSRTSCKTSPKTNQEKDVLAYFRQKQRDRLKGYPPSSSFRTLSRNINLTVIRNSRNITNFLAQPVQLMASTELNLRYVTHPFHQ